MLLPDGRGILRPHHLRPETIDYIASVVDAEEKMDAMTQRLNVQARQTNITTMIPFTPPTTPSLISLASTSSVTSTGSATSQGSQMSTGDNR